MVADTASQLRRVLDYLRIDHTPQQVAEAVGANTFEKLSGGRRPGAIDVSSHYRSGLPGEWKQVLDKDDLREVHRRIGDYLEILGYPMSASGHPAITNK